MKKLYVSFLILTSIGFQNLSNVPKDRADIQAPLEDGERKQRTEE